MAGGPVTAATVTTVPPPYTALKFSPVHSWRSTEMVAASSVWIVRVGYRDWWERICSNDGSVAQPSESGVKRPTSFHAAGMATAGPVGAAVPTGARYTRAICATVMLSLFPIEGSVSYVV